MSDWGSEPEPRYRRLKPGELPAPQPVGWFVIGFMTAILVLIVLGYV